MPCSTHVRPAGGSHEPGSHARIRKQLITTATVDVKACSKRGSGAVASLLLCSEFFSCFCPREDVSLCSSSVCCVSVFGERRGPDPGPLPGPRGAAPPPRQVENVRRLRLQEEDVGTRGQVDRCDGRLVFVLSIRVVVTAEHTEEDVQLAVSCIREAASALLK